MCNVNRNEIKELQRIMQENSENSKKEIEKLHQENDKQESEIDKIIEKVKISKKK